MQWITVCVSGGGVGVDSAREQKNSKPEKMLENEADFPPSIARFVGLLLAINLLLVLRLCEN
jgi:hypothetical protein